MMGLILADQARAVLLSLACEKPESKDEIRRVLMRRKRELMILNRQRLRKYERRALSLIKRVDYSNIRPALAFVAPQDRPVWNYLRHALSSAPWTERPGRCMLVFAVDLNSRGIMGIVDLGSDLFTLSPRDKYIGWTRERRVQESGLRFLCNLGTCVCVSPFGKLTGGKFMSVAATSQRISDIWMTRYGDPLAGITTTSLYGKSSQYNRLKEYKYLGLTSGGGVAHLGYKDYIILREYVNTACCSPGLTGKIGGPGGGVMGRLNAIARACNLTGIPFDDVRSEQPRGVYFAELADNSIDFLCGQANRLNYTNQREEEIAEWWLDRWYSMRYPKFSDQLQAFDYEFYRWDNQIDYCG